jgi:hypothetical protein
MKFYGLLAGLPIVAAGVVAAPKEGLVAKSGKEGAVRKTFTLKHIVNLAPGGGAIRGMGTGDNIRISGADLCGYCTVLEGQIHLTNTADGSPVDEKVVYNHHILTNGPAIPFPLKQSGINLAMSGGFVGAGGDNGNSPFMYYNPSEPKSVITGYQMKKSDSFSTQIVLVNKSSKQQSISVNYELEYIPWDPQAPKPIGESVQSALISASVMPNSNGKSKSNVMTWTKSGTFIFGKGHLHDSGKAMRMWFFKAGTTPVIGKEYYKCESVATYENKAIVGMNACNSTKVSSGDQVLMESEYQASLGSNAAAGGNMAMFRMIFAS